jgi:hypothetical protein
MSEKPETDEFEEDDVEDVAPGSDDVDVDYIMRDVESQRRRSPKGGAEPAWRRLERVMEDRRTAELLSDFDDYKIEGVDDEGEEVVDEPDTVDQSDEDEERSHGAERKKKKLR